MLLGFMGRDRCVAGAAGVRMQSAECRVQSANKKKSRKGKVVILVFGLMIVVALLGFGVSVTPFGVETLTVVNSTSALADNAQSVLAQAGNVTELNIFGVSVTQTWQGYFGNVSGAIILADASDNMMYNWSLADPEGEIYASKSNSVSWGNIQCFNWTENGSYIETSFNIQPDDVDGVDETFSYGNGHDLFYTNNQQFTEGECMSAVLFDSSGAGVNDHYEEVLLWDGDEVVFTSLLEESAVSGFDGRDHDFEMLVLEDGHGVDTDTTTYYFYVELQ